MLISLLLATVGEHAKTNRERNSRSIWNLDPYVKLHLKIAMILLLLNTSRYRVMTASLVFDIDHVLLSLLMSSTSKVPNFIAKTTKMEISNPRRILAVSRPNSGLLDLLKGNITSYQAPPGFWPHDAGLTGSSPSLASDTVAGTTHPWPINTTYYTATVPIWLDEITSPTTWSSEFLAPEAKEVLNALGAFIICFRKPTNEAGLKDVKELLDSVSEVVKEGCGMTWDGICLAVAMPQSAAPYLEKSFEEWEELCQEFGFEFVDFESKGRNDYYGRLSNFAWRNELVLISIRTNGYWKTKRGLRS